MTGPPLPFLTVTDVVVSYGSHLALRGVSLDVLQGKVVGLLGQNGAGKSTLMHAITGLVQLSGGFIGVGGIDVARDQRAARRLIGIAPQDLAVFPSLTVLENLRSWAELSGLRGSRCQRAVVEAIEVMQLGHLRDRRVHRLSGGEQRRVHCAMAIVGKPPLLLLDEPTVGVDPATRRAILGHVEALADEGSAVLYSTHYLAEIEQLGADVVILHQGSVLANGSVASLVSRFSESAVELTFRSPGADEVIRVPAADPVDELPAVLLRFDDRRRDLVGVAIRRPSLEDVFVQVTGGDLDPAAASAADRTPRAGLVDR
ncbi:ABC transporter ATP-binding protein [Micromonospora sp. C95]|uniref:ABC transporter ATP-binding protein n=1 Tax=Micromonospora sp. C95 TaxID=2824882 RepID=UPI001B366C96|nr:ABC transporter ATP-binding protein [Micromonospora sp. C95]MBQ1026020.1 ABC transporter ATP-binding protein [Micromonospora sp. C95]